MSKLCAAFMRLIEPLLNCQAEEKKAENLWGGFTALPINQVQNSLYFYKFFSLAGSLASGWQGELAALPSKHSCFIYCWCGTSQHLARVCTLGVYSTAQTAVFCFDKSHFLATQNVHTLLCHTQFYICPAVLDVLHRVSLCCWDSVPPSSIGQKPQTKVFYSIRL